MEVLLYWKWKTFRFSCFSYIFSLLIGQFTTGIIFNFFQIKHRFLAVRQSSRALFSRIVRYSLELVKEANIFKWHCGNNINGKNDKRADLILTFSENGGNYRNNYFTIVRHFIWWRQLTQVLLISCKANIFSFSKRFLKNWKLLRFYIPFYFLLTVH